MAPPASCSATASCEQRYSTTVLQRYSATASCEASSDLLKISARSNTNENHALQAPFDQFSAPAVHLPFLALTGGNPFPCSDYRFSSLATNMGGVALKLPSLATTMGGMALKLLSLATTMEGVALKPPSLATTIGGVALKLPSLAATIGGVALKLPSLATAMGRWL